MCDLKSRSESPEVYWKVWKGMEGRGEKRREEKGQT
jgi:hypothetical protein